MMKPVADSLVLYKVRPARVLAVADKIEIELEGGQTKRVRPKDIEVLHPGPAARLPGEDPGEGDLEEAWELLQGGETRLAELAELMYGEFTPDTAWATWQRVADGLYFAGTPQAIEVRDPQTVQSERSQREAKAAAKQEWESFIERMGQNRMGEGDEVRLSEVEKVALGTSEHSRILEALGHQVSRENAHRLLVRVGYWSPDYNPYPRRFGINVADPDFPVAELPDEERRDFTGLPAFAIDDEGNQDPDDAISIDGERIWVHVADVAALVSPDSAIDLEARARGSNLYAPERIVPMLPDEITARLGLGLQEESPALSFGFKLVDDALCDIVIVPSRVRVQRLSYQEADVRMEEEPFRSLYAVTERYRRHRHARDAASIDLPEVSLRVADGQVVVRPLQRLRSRDMVTDAMLMAGEAAARFCLERSIPIPFATQRPPSELREPADLAAMWAYRKLFQPSRLSVEPSAHFGLGLELYTRATSPLRRYSDLLVHQQLRAHLRGDTPLDASEVAARSDLAEAGALAIRRAERLSNTHWKLVWLRSRGGWSGEAVVVENDGKKPVVLIEQLALDAKVRIQGDVELNGRVRLKAREIDLPDLACYFSAAAQ